MGGMRYRPINQAFPTREAASNFANNLLAAGWTVEVKELEYEGAKAWAVIAQPTPQVKVKKRYYP